MLPSRRAGDSAGTLPPPAARLPDLNLDEVEGETRAAIATAVAALNDPSASSLTELEHTVVYIGEQVEMFCGVLERLCDEVAGLKKALTSSGPKHRPRDLFPEKDD